jgi:adenine-specific DNA-methyltransferase
MSADAVTRADETTFFRPIQYLGSKWRLLDDIERAVNNVSRHDGAQVIDLFSGSGVVAARLARTRQVTAVDVQEYARVLAGAQLAPAPVDFESLFDRAAHEFALLMRPAVRALVDHESAVVASHQDRAAGVCDLVDFGSMAAMATAAPTTLRALLTRANDELRDAASAVMTRHYGGVYFSYEQAATLDALAVAARQVRDDERDTALAMVLSTASELVASVGGHFAQPVRPRTKDGRVKPGIVTNVARSRAIDPMAAAFRWATRYRALSPSPYASSAVRADYKVPLSRLSTDVGCIYADPPYTREHYSRFYHVLETLALGDEPGLSQVRIGGSLRPSRGLYRHARHQSPFCVVSEAPEAFAALMSPLADAGVPLVLSYSPIPQTDKPRARVMTLGALIGLAERYFGRVEVRSVGAIAHAKLNTRRLNAPATYDAEVLIECQP